MLYNWLNSKAELFSRMVGISDADISNASSADITEQIDWDDESAPFQKGTICDPGIFGRPGENKDVIARIPLPVSVVNINYVSGIRPVLSAKLGLSVNRLLDIVHFVTGVSIDKEKPYPDGISFDSAAGTGNPSACCTALYGADAITALLEYAGEDDLIPYVILHSLPVIPVDLRYIRRKSAKADGTTSENAVWTPTSINTSYFRLLSAADRYRMLLKFDNMPDIIIMNERRLVQDAANAVINNGADGLAKWSNYRPCNSLYETYKVITTEMHAPLSCNTATLIDVCSITPDDFAEMVNGRNKAITDALNAGKVLEIPDDLSLAVSLQHEDEDDIAEDSNIHDRIAPLENAVDRLALRVSAMCFPRYPSKCLGNKDLKDLCYQTGCRFINANCPHRAIAQDADVYAYNKVDASFLFQTITAMISRVQLYVEKESVYACIDDKEKN